MKISLITTVLNEETTIGSFLDSIIEQMLKPDEMIIVDGGSKDRTIEKVEEFKQFERARTKVRYYVFQGANRSKGRNEAIKKATGEIIAVSDAGCILNKNWLKEITAPFNDSSIKTVAGYYLPKTENIFQKCVAPFFCVMPDRIKLHQKDKNFEFLPSSRSFAFRKEVWEKVGGYPENLNYCEDLVFDQKIKRAGFKIVFEPKAIVYWPQRRNLKSVFKQFFNYAVGDGQVFFTRYQTHSAKILLIFLRYFLAIILMLTGFKFPFLWFVLLFLTVLYLLREVIGKYHYVNHIFALIYLPTLRLLGDLAVMLGTIRGIAKVHFKK